MSDQGYMPIDELLTKTGLTIRELRFDIRKGRFPGRIRGDKTLVGRGEFELHMAGLWSPEPKRDPIDFVRKLRTIKELAS